MKIKTVSFSQSIETVYGYGLKKWTKAASEVELDKDSDSPDYAYALARQLVKEQIDKELSEQAEQKGTHERIIQEEPQPDSITSTLNEIEKCKDMTELGSLWLISKGNLTLSSAYKAKEKQLNNAK